MPTIGVRAVLFLSSYSPLFVILVIRDSFENALWCGALIALAVLSIFALLTCLQFFPRQDPHVATAVEVHRRSTEAIGYIVTYLIPFLDVNLDSDSDVIALLVLLGVIGLLYVHSNLIYINPVLNLFGYHLFELTTDHGKQSALITKRDY